MKNNFLIEKIPRKCPKVSVKKLDTLMTSVSKFDTTVANGKKQQLSCSWRESKQFIITRFYNSSVQYFKLKYLSNVTKLKSLTLNTVAKHEKSSGLKYI